MARGIIGAPRRVNYRGSRRATTMSASPPKATNERTFPKSTLWADAVEKGLVIFGEQ